MKMKEQYEKLELEVVTLEQENAILTSYTDPHEGEGDNF